MAIWTELLRQGPLNPAQPGMVDGEPPTGKAVFTVTETSPVAWSAAVMPGELSTITLSPKIQSR